ncbi:MAG: phycobilisome linker polypeptide [Mastigocoleus sp.]
MSGMATTINTSEVCDYSNRTAVIEVTGLCRQNVIKRSNYVMKVPYSQMSETIRRITRTGGKIANVEIVSFHLGELGDTNSSLPKGVAIASDNSDTQTEVLNEGNTVPEIESSKYLADFEDNPEPVKKAKNIVKKVLSGKRKTSKRKRKN